MPIYAYRCEACGHAKDVLQKVSDPLLTVCPACGADAFKKQVTAAGFQLKGSGWYVTDFRGDAKAGKPAADGTAVPPPKDTSGAADAAKADSGSGKGGADKNGAAPAAAKTDGASAKASTTPAAAPASGSGSAPGGQ